MRHHALLVTFVLFGCASQPPPAPVCPSSPAAPVIVEKPATSYDGLSNEELARKLMEVTGSGKIGHQIMNGMLDDFRKIPNASPRFIEEFRRRAKPEELVDLIVPIYVKHYDRDTMIAALHFYETDAGKTFVAKSPIATAEAVEAGRAWGKKLAEDVVRSLKDRPTSP